MSLDNYDELTDHQKHIKNVRGSLELVIYDNDVMCKILPTTFRGNDLCAKLVARFSTSIPMKKSFAELFRVIQGGKESTLAYMRRFNEEMLQVKDLLEPITCEALIKGVRNEELWKQLHPLQNRTLKRVKQMIESHIRVEEA
uniref:Retrotransposon gag domain-containing protein n=1 Tax=Populus trichocarpa TaxID=3694 RepID=U7E2F4_POPTR